VQIGLIGLGRMGGNMAIRLRKAGIEVTGFDRNPETTDVASLSELVACPARPPDRLGDGAVRPSHPGHDRGGRRPAVSPVTWSSIGGNSRFTDDFIHAEMLQKLGVEYLDCGVSGGVWGLANGYGLMVGGEQAVVERAMPIFDALRPEGPREESFVHAGAVGAGHYAKMVHNGVEYGLMQAYAEGYELLTAKDIVTDVHGTFKAWTRGTVVRSWLLDLMVKALEADPIWPRSVATWTIRARAGGPSRRRSPTRCPPR
jgi:6-phosphogluconate dehydrogenase